MSARDEKARLRTATRAAIRALDPTERRRAEHAILDRLRRQDWFRQARTILLYCRAFPEEIDTTPLLWQALAADAVLALPRVDRVARRLTLHAVESLEHDLVPGRLGIQEPRAGLHEVAPGQLDALIVPGLVFDTHGGRIGRGGGFYDRLLAVDALERVPCWALAFDCQIVDAVPLEPHDQPLSGVLTPTRRLLGTRAR